MKLSIVEALLERVKRALLRIVYNIADQGHEVYELASVKLLSLGIYIFNIKNIFKQQTRPSHNGYFSDSLYKHRQKSWNIEDDKTEKCEHSQEREH